MADKIQSPGRHAPVHFVSDMGLIEKGLNLLLAALRKAL